jgi:hypothetical protein
LKQIKPIIALSKGGLIRRIADVGLMSSGLNISGRYKLWGLGHEAFFVFNNSIKIQNLISDAIVLADDSIKVLDRDLVTYGDTLRIGKSVVRVKQKTLFWTSRARSINLTGVDL